jgi:hypothetical protein
VKVALVSALCACAGGRRKRKARRFLEGLSENELQYIAGFLGACILESAVGLPSVPGQLVETFGAFEHLRGAPASGAECLDCKEHKIVLVREYLSRCGVDRWPAALRARRRRC